MYFVIIIPYNDIITIRRTLDLFVRKTFTIMKIHKQHFTLICSVLIAMLLFLMFDSETAKAEVDLTVLPEVKEESESFSELQVDEDITATIFEEETVINPTEESSEVLPENLSSEDDIANSFPEMNENLIEPVPEESQDFPVEDFVIEPEIDSEETPAEIVEPSLEPDSSEEILMEELPAEPSDQLIEKEDIEADLEQEVKDTDLELTKEEPNYEIRPIGNNLYFVNTETGEVRKDNAWIDYKDSRIFPNKEGILYRNQLITFGPSSAFYMDNDGFMTKDKIVEYRNNLYYMDKTTGNKRMDNKWIDLDDYHIFPNAEGLLYRNQFITFGPEKIHYMGSDGKATKGLKRVGNDLHYFDESTNEPLKRGIMRKDNKWVKPSGSTESVFVNDKGVVYTNQLLTFGPEITYYMGNDGYKVKGKIVEYGNNLYYMDKTTGNKRMDNKWIDLNGNKIYPNAEGILYRNQFITFGPEVAYYMNNSGYLDKGNSDGIIQIKLEPLVYSVTKVNREDGKLIRQPGWIEYNGKKYFMNNFGMPYRNQFITFGPNIAYYMSNNGSAIINKSITLNNIPYSFDKNGILTTSYSGFEIINSYLYYFNNMINPIKGWYTVSNHGRIYGDLDTGRILYKNSIRMINGKEYLFNNNGSCTPTNSGYSYSTKLLTPWVSQLTPIYAPNGCELASALSGMRYQGYATNVSINRLISEMSSSSNPYYGFTTDPYQHSLGTIYPSALLPLIKKYAPNSYDMSRSTVDQWRNALDEGTPIVLWCTANFRAPNYCGLGYPCNTHVQLITGYSKMNNTFSIMDPYTWTAKSAHRIVNSTQLLNSNNYGGRFAIGIK